MIAFFTATLLALCAPQEAYNADGNPILRYDQLDYQSYEPRHVDLESLYQHAQEFFSRELEVDGRAVNNLTTLDDSILVYDTREMTDRILADLQRFDNLLAEKHGPPAQSEAQYEVMEYRPRGLSADSILSLLGPFARTIEVQDDYGNTISAFDNVTVVEESGMLLLRDTPARLQEMRTLLERVDQPTPQVFLTCYVLRGLAPGEASTIQSVPAELQRSLQALLPGVNLCMEAVGILRSTTAAGHDLNFNMDGLSDLTMPDDEHYRRSYHLQFVTGAYDLSSGTLNLDSCAFTLSDPVQGDRDVFTTATAVRNNEYAVLGVLGAEPLFVVLQVRPVGQNPM